MSEVVGKWRLRVGEGVARDHRAGQQQSQGGTEAPARWSCVISPRHTFQKASVEAACPGWAKMPGPSEGSGHQCPYASQTRKDEQRERRGVQWVLRRSWAAHRQGRAGKRALEFVRTSWRRRTPHKPQHGGKAVQEIHKREMSDLD